MPLKICVTEGILRLLWRLGEQCPKLVFKLFDCQMQPVLTYGREVWGIMADNSITERVHLFADKSITERVHLFADNSITERVHLFADNSIIERVHLFADNSIIERVHLFAIKRFLNVSARTPSAVVYGETGRYPLHLNTYTRLFVYH